MIPKWIREIAELDCFCHIHKLLDDNNEIEQTITITCQRCIALTKIAEGMRELREEIETARGMGGGYDESHGGRRKLPRYREEYYRGKTEARDETLKKLPTEAELTELMKGGE
jgi:hypothetical protein